MTITSSLRFLYILGGSGLLCAPPHILANQLTLFKPGGQIMPLTLLPAPPDSKKLSTPLLYVLCCLFCVVCFYLKCCLLFFQHPDKTALKKPKEEPEERIVIAANPSASSTSSKLIWKHLTRDQSGRGSVAFVISSSCTTSNLRFTSNSTPTSLHSAALSALDFLATTRSCASI